MAAKRVPNSGLSYFILRDSDCKCALDLGKCLFWVALLCEGGSQPTRGLACFRVSPSGNAEGSGFIGFRAYRV